MRYAKKAMIVAPQPEPTEAGADVLREGGNAVDAGIACALVQGVVDPMMCGIAGFGSCGIYMPGKKFHGYIDAHAPAPLCARPDMWANLIESEARDGYGFILRGRVNDIGYKSICAPANLKMYYEAHKEHGSLPWSALLSIEDLKAWKPVRNAPLWGDYRGYRVSTNQPPGGGVMLLEMLNILENFDLGGLEHNSMEYVRIVSEAMKCATIDKDAHVGDPKFVDVPLERLTSKSYAKTMAGEIMRGVKAEVPRFNSGAVSKDTTHISVLDKDGNCFTMTHSLGMPSGVVTPGLGFMYNGCMGVFDPRPDRAGSIAPGKARFSSVVPSIIFKDGQPHLIIGAPGATQIAMGVLHVVLNALDFDMTMVEAVSAPRFSATSDAIDISNRIQWKVERELQAQGYPVVRSPYTFGFAAVHGIRVHDDGLDGGADPGHDGVVIAV